MACAQTGSGKTAAFLLPILHNILEDECDPHTGDAPQKPQAVIVAPTRELALQIKEEARKFALQSVAKAVVAYGGTSSGYQLAQLFKGCNVLIATPGRLMDFVEKGKKDTVIRSVQREGNIFKNVDFGFQMVKF